jgi:predicted alpha/beta hydrolase family esterase
MGRPAYLILHGYQGSGPGHWQTWLAGRLRSGDAKVHYPDLPDADHPRLDAWLDAVAGELDAIGEPPVVLCHSLACIVWMHHVAAGGKPAARVLLVAPPSATGVPDELKSFVPAPGVTVPDGRLVCSDNDPYCPEGAVSLYGAADVLPGAGHINPDAGYGPWPAVEAWARAGVTPLTP